MPTWIKDEDKWRKAKQLAKQAGQGTNYPYIVGIYKKMGGRIKEYQFKLAMLYGECVINKEFEESEYELITNINGKKRTLTVKGSGNMAVDNDTGEVFVKKNNKWVRKEFKEGILSPGSLAIVTATGDYEGIMKNGKSFNGYISINQGQKVKVIRKSGFGYYVWLVGEETQAWIPEKYLKKL